VPELPVDPNDILRGLDAIRSALVAPGNVGDSLPRAVDRAAEVTVAINRLTDEVAKLNAHVERALPLIESIDQQVKRSIPVVESLQQAETGVLTLWRSIRRAAREGEVEDEPPGAATDRGDGADRGHVEDAGPDDPR
jgi:hypothetical protein